MIYIVAGIGIFAMGVLCGAVLTACIVIGRDDK